MPILMIGVGGFLIGGVVSAAKAKKPLPAIVLGVLAAVAIAGGILWLWPT
ncbi:hypothetical protein Snas_3994 [Stackebrandtia nassauensis DSM 44728]|uniref:Amidotransferase n=1 Tax=Stackebrandtia nassauensis (strain DSM 44728 / CIP 108903 / NRRL B-16338 / NBRC 102104 / LLR-40K-21) TaxID=446470 RepID=D3PZV9_STANL|nr:hypothetical protein Snas_3994 [Stackebrandtia nassauensis DSM 44728]